MRVQVCEFGWCNRFTFTLAPPNTFTPRYFGRESLPFAVDPPAFFVAVRRETSGVDGDLNPMPPRLDSGCWNWERSGTPLLERERRRMDDIAC